MFTLDQIKSAQTKVRTGSGFPAYIREIKKMGVLSYETFVQDIHTDHYGVNGFKLPTPPNENVLSVSGNCAPEQFKTALKAHQQGKTDFSAFRLDCAKTGVNKWITSIEKMTCTYYDKQGNLVLMENIPG